MVYNTYFNEGKKCNLKEKKICAVNGEGTVNDQTCPKWFVKFHAEDFLLNDVPQSGRLIEVYGNQIRTLLENNEYYMMHIQNIKAKHRK